MEFGTVLIVVAVVAAVVGIASYWGSGAIYSGLGRTGGLSMDGEEQRERAAKMGPTTAAGRAEASEEIRQMLEAKSDRREARGQAPLDIEAEMASLTRPAAPRDAALRDEVRQLVVARNERRGRQGKPPLDVEEEIERQLRDLGG